MRLEKGSRKSVHLIRFALSHQIADRKTNEDKAVKDVCEPPSSDPFTEQRKGMKSTFFIKPKIISFPRLLFSWGPPPLCEEFSVLAELFICAEIPFVLAREAVKQGQEEKEILPQLLSCPTGILLT